MDLSKNEFLIDNRGNQIWYDLKSNVLNSVRNISYRVKYPFEIEFYVRPHREDGPAIITSSGIEIYVIHGNKHREDGPARIWASGHIEWWLNNQYQPFFDIWCKKLNKSPEEINFLKLKWNLV